MLSARIRLHKVLFSQVGYESLIPAWRAVLGKVFQSDQATDIQLLSPGRLGAKPSHHNLLAWQQHGAAGEKLQSE